MCLPVSRLFWVSSLAYPNLLGTKGYVVVVVVRSRTANPVKCTMEFGTGPTSWPEPGCSSSNLFDGHCSNPSIASVTLQEHPWRSRYHKWQSCTRVLVDISIALCDRSDQGIAELSWLPVLQELELDHTERHPPKGYFIFVRFQNQHDAIGWPNWLPERRSSSRFVRFRRGSGCCCFAHVREQ
jgi:hypothetical protein